MKKVIIKDIDGVKVNISKSSDSSKKYMASFLNPKTNRINTVHFGAAKYEQWRDSTGLGIYSHLDHNDPKRKKLYYDRHGTSYEKFSPGWFSSRFLW